MNPEDFSVAFPECENEKPFRVGGHWDEMMLEIKMAPGVGAPDAWE